jgi:VIT1/CCC1 family predicted Fe2+/Mn2+ transporter
VIAGFSGLLAGSLSMATGEYISVKTQRELLEYQLTLERQELATMPEEEVDELAAIYEARGLGRDAARDLASRLVADPEHGLETLAREELGLDPRNLVSPIAAALASFTSFAAGALIPLAPVFLPTASPSLAGTLVAMEIGLLTVGGLMSLFTGRGVVWSALRMAILGPAAGATFHRTPAGRRDGGVTAGTGFGRRDGFQTRPQSHGPRHGRQPARGRVEGHRLRHAPERALIGHQRAQVGDQGVEIPRRSWSGEHRAIVPRNQTERFIQETGQRRPGDLRELRPPQGGQGVERPPTRAIIGTIPRQIVASSSDWELSEHRRAVIPRGLERPARVGRARPAANSSSDSGRSSSPRRGRSDRGTSPASARRAKRAPHVSPLRAGARPTP